MVRRHEFSDDMKQIQLNVSLMEVRERCRRGVGEVLERCRRGGTMKGT